jgi:hypothetical protein
MRVGISDNLHGDGHFTSIGARFESRKCPHLPGETAAKLLDAPDAHGVHHCLARDLTNCASYDWKGCQNVCRRDLTPCTCIRGSTALAALDWAVSECNAFLDPLLELPDDLRKGAHQNLCLGRRQPPCSRRSFPVRGR